MVPCRKYLKLHALCKQRTDRKQQQNSQVMLARSTACICQLQLMSAVAYASCDHLQPTCQHQQATSCRTCVVCQLLCNNAEAPRHEQTKHRYVSSCAAQCSVYLFCFAKFRTETRGATLLLSCKQAGKRSGLRRWLKQMSKSVHQRSGVSVCA